MPTVDKLDRCVHHRGRLIVSSILWTAMLILSDSSWDGGLIRKLDFLAVNR